MMNVSPDKPGLHSYQKEVKPVDDRSPLVAELHLGELLAHPFQTAADRVCICAQALASGSAP